MELENYPDEEEKDDINIDQAIRRSRHSYRRNTTSTMTTSKSIVSAQGPLPIERKLKGRGNKIVVGTVVRQKSGS